MATERIYGDIPGYPVGSTFASRADLVAAHVHSALQAGISGGRDGADSIVVSGGYVDDLDLGHEIIYTGQGGQDRRKRGKQIADQEFIRGNIGLARSQLDGRPVRVIRGAKGDPRHSPRTGFRYDGLFRVVDHWNEIGKDGYRIWRFHLVKLESSESSFLEKSPDVDGAPARTFATVQRVIRNTSLANRVKRLHDFTCQVCGIRLVTPAGPYAEGAHIRALGRPHDGPDQMSNILCLCPNDHLLFDTGTIYVDSAGIVRQHGTATEVGKLRTSPNHQVDYAYLAYHRQHHGHGLEEPEPS